MTKAPITRACLETDDGAFVRVSHLRENPDLVATTIEPIKRDIKDAIAGLGPLFGRDQLLALVAEVIEEDFNPDGPQTIPAGEWNERWAEEALAHAR